MRFDCIEKPLRRFFYYYGGLVARFPLLFLTIAILITSLLAGGLPYLTYNKDTLNLLAPETGRWKAEKKIAVSAFDQLDDNNVLPNRLIEPGRYAGAIITHADKGESLIEKEPMEEILRFHKIVSNISVSDREGDALTYQDLCMMWQGRCIENSILMFYDYNASLTTERQLEYPFTTLSNGYPVFIGADLGGLKAREDGEVQEVSEVEVMRLFYFLRGIDEADDRRSALWEDEYARVITQFKSDTINISWSTSQTLLGEVDKTVNEVLGLWWIGIVLVIFCIGAASTNNWVQSQPLLCLMGMVAAAMAILAAYGLMGFIKVPYNILSGSVPFLILGISLDDTFIIIGSWRQTSSQKSTEERMKECFCESALSITITSLTDAVAFSIGIHSDFAAVQDFSKTCVSAIVLCYLFQLLFFAPCLVFSGKRQEQNRHCFTFRKVKPKPKAKSLSYRIFCAGDSAHDGVAGTPAMKFFRDYYGPFLNNGFISVIVVLLYSAYIGTAMWGFTLLEEGFQERNWVLDNSHLVNYYDLQEQYFTHFGPQINVIAPEEVNYWDPDVQQSLDDTLKELEASDYIFESSRITTSWLRDYVQYLDTTGRRGNISKKVFLETLRDEFLMHPLYTEYNLDIVFGEDNDTIKASRFSVFSKDMHNKRQESNMMIECRDVADKSDVHLVVYHANFVMYDQYIIMWPNTLQNLLIATAAMFVISLFLIPHPICAIIVTLSIASIIMGVLGYMSIWDIPLNHISMVNLILCVGFSVDFSAHVCYAFISSSADDKKDRVRYALYTLGLPILQGGLSTILACVGTSTTDAYSYRIFFKTMFLVITLGMLHGLVFLPVFLKIFIPDTSKRIKTTDKKSPEEKKEADAQTCKAVEKYSNPICQDKTSYNVLTETGDDECKVNQNSSKMLTGEITGEWTWTGNSAEVKESDMPHNKPNPTMRVLYNPSHQRQGSGTVDITTDDKQYALLPYVEQLSQDWAMLQQQQQQREEVPLSATDGELQPVGPPLMLYGPSVPTGELKHMRVSVKYTYSEVPATTTTTVVPGDEQLAIPEQQVEPEVEQCEQKEQCDSLLEAGHPCAIQPNEEQLQRFAAVQPNSEQLQCLILQETTELLQKCADDDNKLQQCIAAEYEPINQTEIDSAVESATTTLCNQTTEDHGAVGDNLLEVDAGSSVDPDRETVI